MRSQVAAIQSPHERDSAISSKATKSASPPLNVYELARRYFDPDYYLALNGDIRDASIDPFEHYFNFGWREGRDPSCEFSTRYYLSAHVTEIPRETCPLVHYALEGEGRRLSTRPITAQATELISFLARLGLNPSLVRKDLLERFVFPMFSPSAYRASKGLGDDASDAFLLALYVTQDLPVGGSPGPLFDPDFYAREAAAAGLPPIDKDNPAYLHWLRYGVLKRVSPTPLYSDTDYLQLNKDLETYPDWLFHHFVNHGLAEGRQLIPFAHVAHYSTLHLQPQYKSAIDRFIQAIGKASATFELDRMREFRSSSELSEILVQALELEPEIGQLDDVGFLTLPPWHDATYGDFASIMGFIPKGEYRSVILMPFCKLGGADYVAGVLARSLELFGPTLILRTEQSDWARPDWFPASVEAVDLSRHLSVLGEEMRTRVLYEIVRAVGAKDVFNVNSRLGFLTFERFGRRMATFVNLHCYYFCADRTQDGREVGYPVSFFANILPYLQNALFDTKYLSDRLAGRFSLDKTMRSKMRVAYTPAMTKIPPDALAIQQTAGAKRRARPIVLWAGRLDRQKRFDLVIAIASAMPDVDFVCWGKAVLDAPGNLDELPENVEMREPFTTYDELPLKNADGWLYTSAWDGLPTILIEIGALGVPIVASAVGGVPELVDGTTGWLVQDVDSVPAYVASLREMLESPAERVRRAQALQARVMEQHDKKSYHSLLQTICGGQVQ